MSDFDILVGVRTHLLEEGGVPRVHLALPPKALYPLVLMELEEMWSSYSPRERSNGTEIQGRIKFKLSVYSQQPSMNEADSLSYKIKNCLEGLTLWLPEPKEEKIHGSKSISIRFLASVSETPGGAHLGTWVVHHYYDSIIRGTHERRTN